MAELDKMFTTRDYVGVTDEQIMRREPARGWESAAGYVGAAFVGGITVKEAVEYLADRTSAQANDILAPAAIAGGVYTLGRLLYNDTCEACYHGIHPRERVEECGHHEYPLRVRAAGLGIAAGAMVYQFNAMMDLFSNFNPSNLDEALFVPAGWMLARLVLGAYRFIRR